MEQTQLRLEAVKIALEEIKMGKCDKELSVRAEEIYKFLSSTGNFTSREPLGGEKEMTINIADAKTISFATNNLGGVGLGVQTFYDPTNPSKVETLDLDKQPLQPDQNRSTGRTTRIIDEAIQKLFDVGKLAIPFIRNPECDYKEMFIVEDHDLSLADKKQYENRQHKLAELIQERLFLHTERSKVFVNQTTQFLFLILK